MLQAENDQLVDQTWQKQSEKKSLSSQKIRLKSASF